MNEVVDEVQLEDVENGVVADKDVSDDILTVIWLLLAVVVYQKIKAHTDLE